MNIKFVLNDDGYDDGDALADTICCEIIVLMFHPLLQLPPLLLSWHIVSAELHYTWMLMMMTVVMMVVMMMVVMMIQVMKYFRAFTFPSSH